MSMNSKLTRDKHGQLILDGKPIVLGCDTGDDSPVIADQRFDLDLNKLVSSELARQEILKIPGSNDFQDLTDYPSSLGEAENRAINLRRGLESILLPGENYAAALERLTAVQAQAQASIRDLNAKRASSVPPEPPTTPPAAPVAPQATPPLN